MTVAELKTLVLARLEPQNAAPSYNSIATSQYTRWADDKIPGIVQFFIEQKRFDIIEELIEPDQSVTISSGVGSLVSVTDFDQALALKVTTAKIHVLLLPTPDDYAKWDSSSFLTTPREERPVGIIMDNKVNIKPSTVSTPAYLDYLKKHPSLTGSQNTLFKAPADEMLVEEVYQLALESIEVMEG